MTKAATKQITLAQARKIERNRMDVKAKITDAAQQVLDWAEAHRDSKVYAWAKLADKVSFMDVAMELADNNITTFAKAIVHYRAVAKAMMQQEA